MSKDQVFSSVKSACLKSVVGLFFIYALALTSSMAAMEISSWTIALLFTLYYLTDRFSKKRSVEVFTLGAEVPIFLLIIFVAIGLGQSPAVTDNATYFAALGSLRNLILLFFLAYGLQLLRNLNGLLFTLVAGATLVAGYGIWQHFTGIDLWRGDNRALVPINWGDKNLYSTVGFFSHHLTFGHSYMMILCLPWAAMILQKRRPWYWHLGIGLSFAVILTSIICTYGRGVWIALAVALPIMALFASRRLFIFSLLLLSIVSGILMKVSPEFKERALSVFAQNYHSNEERKKLWQANVQMFQDSPWLGVGYRQNEALSQEYYKKMGIAEGMSGHAHSNYLEMLSTTGILGFGAYMLFILAFVLLTIRLYGSIPRTHYWHRVFALAALGAQIALHVGGLTQWNFGDSEVQHQYILWLAIVGYMSHRYYCHIVSDDHAL
ncbi:MAG: O-antigen ligase family protein [Oligoflexia bacterium]|nr:O-antigen ligase family protein [Oligoflexia bacterium]